MPVYRFRAKCHDDDLRLLRALESACVGGSVRKTQEIPYRLCELEADAPPDVIRNIMRSVGLADECERAESFRQNLALYERWKLDGRL